MKAHGLNAQNDRTPRCAEEPGVRGMYIVHRTKLHTVSHQETAVHYTCDNLTLKKLYLMLSSTKTLNQPFISVSLLLTLCGKMIDNKRGSY